MHTAELQCKHFRSVHPVLPSGIHKFKGQILHSQEYRIPDAFRGKRILVVGLGNTGGDIAVELSEIAAQVFLTISDSVSIPISMDSGYREATKTIDAFPIGKLCWHEWGNVPKPLLVCSFRKHTSQNVTMSKRLQKNYVNA